MSRDQTFEELWEAPSLPRAPIERARMAQLPPLARMYLEHALGADACAEGRAASAVRLKMHGEIRLKEWFPFEAEQVIRFQRGFVWRAKVSMHGLPVTGSDRFVDGEGRMQWKMLGILPVMTGDGPDITRSALGRVQIESIWMPSVLLAPGVTWEQTDAAHVGVNLSLREQAAHLDLTVSPEGALERVQMRRWGNPEGGAFHESPFGGLVLEERTFEGVTIPTKLRIGWHPQTDGFADEGEFFRVTVDHATFR